MPLGVGAFELNGVRGNIQIATHVRGGAGPTPGEAVMVPDEKSLMPRSTELLTALADGC